MKSEFTDEVVALMSKPSDPIPEEDLRIVQEVVLLHRRPVEVAAKFGTSVHKVRLLAKDYRANVKALKGMNRRRLNKKTKVK